MSTKSCLTVIACVAATALAGAPSAMAGEATGKPGPEITYTPVAGFIAKSICSFSGLNTEPDEPGRTQSWGQIPKDERGEWPPPRIACNGHTGFLAG